MLNSLSRASLIATALSLSVLWTQTLSANTWSGMSYPNKNQPQATAPKSSQKQTSSSDNECKTGAEWKQTDTHRSYGPFYTYPDSGSKKHEAVPHRKPKMKTYPRVKPILEAKAGYFFFTDHKLKKVYDQGGLDLQIAASYPIWRWFQIYLSAEFFERKGRSLHFHERTRVWGWPVSLGIKTVATMSCWAQYYFTIGPRYFYFHVHNNSSHVDRELNHSAVGGFIGTGFDFFLTKHLVIDIFGEYSYCRTHFHGHKDHVYGEDRQIGGFTFGGGLGYAF